MDLTPREREIATLNIDGMTDAQIAHALVVSRLTIAAHRANIRAKLAPDPGDEPPSGTSPN